MSDVKTDVLLIAGSFTPREGGAEKQLRLILSNLVAEGHSVVVATQILPDPNIPRLEKLDGLTVRRLGSRRLFKYAPILGRVSFLISATRLALMVRPKALLSLQLGTASLVASLTSRIYKTPHILRLTGGGSAKFRSEPLARKASLYGRFMLRLISHRQTTVLAPARHLIDDFLECVPEFPGYSVQIINGIERKKTSHLIRQSQVVWYSRRGSEKSGKIFKEIAERLPHINFLVIGNFPEQTIPANVKLLGWVTDPEYVLAESSVLLNTSLYEGMPNTVLQAIAYGCRVVGLSNAGMKEVKQMFPESVDIVDQKQVTELAQKVEQAVYKPEPVSYEVPTTASVLKDWSEILLKQGNSQ